MKMPPAGLVNEHTCVSEKEKTEETARRGLTTKSSIGMGRGSLCLKQVLNSLTAVRTTVEIIVTRSTGIFVLGSSRQTSTTVCEEKSGEEQEGTERDNWKSC